MGGAWVWQLSPCGYPGLRVPGPCVDGLDEDPGGTVCEEELALGCMFQDSEACLMGKMPFLPFYHQEVSCAHFCQSWCFSNDGFSRGVLLEGASRVGMGWAGRRASLLGGWLWLELPREDNSPTYRALAGYGLLI